MDRGAWQATVHGVTKEPDRTEQLNMFNNILKNRGGIIVWVSFIQGLSDAIKNPISFLLLLFSTVALSSKFGLLCCGKMVNAISGLIDP